MQWVVEGEPIKHKTSDTEHKSNVHAFLANVSSLSEKTMRYVTRHRNKFDMMVLLETHKTNTNFFQRIGYEAHIPPVHKTSDRGTHGGEIVAGKKHMNNNDTRKRYGKSLQKTHQYH